MRFSLSVADSRISTASEALLAVRIRLQAGAWQEAFLCQRRICERLGSKRQMSAQALKDMRLMLLRLCFDWLLVGASMIENLILLPLTANEEQCLVQYLVEREPAAGNVDNGASLDIYTGYLLQRSRVSDSYCVDSLAQPLRGIASNRAAQETRATILQAFRRILPAPARVQMERRAAAAAQLRDRRDLKLHEAVEALRTLSSNEMLSRAQGRQTRMEHGDGTEGAGDADGSGGALVGAGGSGSGMGAVASARDLQSRSGAADVADVEMTPAKDSQVHRLRADSRRGTPLACAFGTPPVRHALLKMALSKSPAEFAKAYSPAMLSPVVKGTSPFTPQSSRRTPARRSSASGTSRRLLHTRSMPGMEAGSTPGPSLVVSPAHVEPSASRTRYNLRSGKR